MQKVLNLQQVGLHGRGVRRWLRGHEEQGELLVLEDNAVVTLPQIEVDVQRLCDVAQAFSGKDDHAGFMKEARSCLGSPSTHKKKELALPLSASSTRPANTQQPELMAFYPTLTKDIASMPSNSESLSRSSPSVSRRRQKSVRTQKRNRPSTSVNILESSQLIKPQDDPVHDAGIVHLRQVAAQEAPRKDKRESWKGSAVLAPPINPRLRALRGDSASLSISSPSASKPNLSTSTFLRHEGLKKIDKSISLSQHVPGGLASGLFRSSSSTYRHSVETVPFLSAFHTSPDGRTEKDQSVLLEYLKSLDPLKSFTYPSLKEIAQHAYFQEAHTGKYLIKKSEKGLVETVSLFLYYNSRLSGRTGTSSLGGPSASTPS
jgi:hypothetical protein